MVYVFYTSKAILYEKSFAILQAKPSTKICKKSIRAFEK